MKKFFFIILSVFLIPATYSQSTVDDVHTDNKEVNIRFENRKKKGYYNTTQIGMLMGNRQISGRIPYYYYPYYYGVSSMRYLPYYDYTRTELQFSPSVTITNGYMFNEHWAAGIGVGFEIFNRNLFPVFVDIRYTLWDAKISPFFAVKTGYAIGNLKKKHYENQLYFDFEPYYAYNADLRNYGGFMLHPEMGVKIPLGENADLMFTVAYRYQKIKTKVTQKYDYAHFDEWENKASLNRLSFGVAIMFR